jgi:hypothetical protein
VDPIVARRLRSVKRLAERKHPKLSKDESLNAAVERVIGVRATVADLMLIYRDRADQFENGIIKCAREYIAAGKPAALSRVDLRNPFEVAGAIVSYPPQDEAPSHFAQALLKAALPQRESFPHRGVGIYGLWAHLCLMAMGGPSGLYLRRKLHGSAGSFHERK